MKKRNLLKDILVNIRLLDEFQKLPNSEKSKLDREIQKLESMMPGVKKEPRRKTSIYQLKVSLIGVRPPIWRRIQVPGNIKFDALHEVIQIAMGWQNFHLYSFNIDDVFIETPESEEEFDFSLPRFREQYDASKEKLNKWVSEEKSKLTYTYDFGDNWEHSILVEKIEESAKKLDHPVCLKGKRACPPEDCGGMYGYKILVDSIAGNGLGDDVDDEYREHLLSNYEHFDPDEFDLEFVNTLLAEIKC